MLLWGRIDRPAGWAISSFRGGTPRNRREYL